MAASWGSLYVDTSMLSADINRLRTNMSPEKFERAMYGVFKQTGKHLGVIIGKDVPKEYVVKNMEARKVVKSPRLSMGGGFVNCTIPLTGPRKGIGGGYAATGSARGWQSLRKKYRVKARILRAGKSTLPANMTHQGNQPPFRNIPSKLGGVTFTRKGKARFPIVKVSGIAIPQMPMNRSADQVEEDIVTYMHNRLIHRYMALISSGR